MVASLHQHRWTRLVLVLMKNHAESFDKIGCFGFLRKLQLAPAPPFVLTWACWLFVCSFAICFGQLSPSVFGVLIGQRLASCLVAFAHLCLCDEPAVELGVALANVRRSAIVWQVVPMTCQLLVRDLLAPVPVPLAHFVVGYHRVVQNRVEALLFLFRAVGFPIFAGIDAELLGCLP